MSRGGCLVSLPLRIVLTVVAAAVLIIILTAVSAAVAIGVLTAVAAGILTAVAAAILTISVVVHIVVIVSHCGYLLIINEFVLATGVV